MADDGFATRIMDAIKRYADGDKTALAGMKVGWVDDLLNKIATLEGAIKAHHTQKADDRCIEDDDKLYAAAGLPPCDRRVGDKDAMLANCKRFIDRRCEGGGWLTYAELEEQRNLAVDALNKIITNCGSAFAADSRLGPKPFVDLIERLACDTLNAMALKVAAHGYGSRQIGGEADRG